jgi:hypothetical protein
MYIKTSVTICVHTYAYIHRRCRGPWVSFLPTTDVHLCQCRANHRRHARITFDGETCAESRIVSQSVREYGCLTQHSSTCTTGFDYWALGSGRSKLHGRVSLYEDQVGIHARGLCVRQWHHGELLKLFCAPLLDVCVDKLSLAHFDVFFWWPD